MEYGPVFAKYTKRTIPQSSSFAAGEKSAKGPDQEIGSLASIRSKSMSPLEMKATISEKFLKMILVAILMLGFTLFSNYETFQAGAFSIGAQAAEIVHGK